MTVFKLLNHIFVLLLIITLIILLAVGMQNIAMIIFCILAAAVYAGFTLFLMKKQRKSNEKIINILRKVSANNDTDEQNNYERRVTELNNLRKEIKELNNKEKEKELKQIYENLEITTARFIEELTITKKFKVNRNEFLGNVAHELRTPICAIQLSLETLINGAVSDNNVNVDFLKRALSHTNRLSELSNDLINISKLEAGMKLSKRYVKINDLITEVIHSLHFISSSQKINIKTNFAVKDSVQVFCDSNAIKQVIMNLIDNAIKYTDEGGEVLISTESAEKEVFVSVKDSGVGIPREDIARIFERFYRVEKTRSRDMGGSGLGLSIVKHIIELHNSKITVESKVGEGTEFRFGLPL